jgi:hypothetical protein
MTVFRNAWQAKRALLRKKETAMSGLNQEGRKANAAQNLGDREGIQSQDAAKKTAEKERRSAGPDGPDATDITSKQDGLLNRGGDPVEGER